jgi:hypothetical protein
VTCELLRRSQTRINLLFTMSEIPHARPVKDATCEVMFRGRYSLVRRKARRRPLGYAGHASPFGTCVAVPREARRAKRGGARRDRTDDLMLAKHALSQLSYGPIPEDECFAGCKLDKIHMRSIKVVGLGRLELPTSRLSSARSNQLSYKPLHKERARAHRRSCQCIAQAQPLARVRPRRKRNEDGEIPPMELNDLAIVGP